MAGFCEPRSFIVNQILVHVFDSCNRPENRSSGLTIDYAYTLCQRRINRPLA